MTIVPNPGPLASFRIRPGATETAGQTGQPNAKRAEDWPHFMTLRE